MNKPLTEIEIVGRKFRIGTLTWATLAEAQPDAELLARKAAQGNGTVDLYGEDSAEVWAAMERMALILLRDGDQSLTIEWLDDHCPAAVFDEIGKEFQRQALELAANAGLAGSA